MKRRFLKKLIGGALTLALVLSLTPAGSQTHIAKAATASSVTASGGYSTEVPVAEGMTKSYVYDGLATLDITVDRVSSSMNGYMATIALKLRFDLTPMVDGGVNTWFWSGRELKDIYRFKDSSGTVVDKEGGNGDTNLKGKKLTAYQIVEYSSGATGLINYDCGGIQIGETETIYPTFEFLCPLSINSIDATNYIKAIGRNYIEISTANLSALGEGVESVGVFYKKKSASEWKQSESFKITGLSSNTEYQVRLNYSKTVDINGQKKLCSSPYTNALTLKTYLAATPKPVIKSVKITGAKVKTRTTDGYWSQDSLGNWHWNKPTSYKVTECKVTVKIKKKVPGAIGYFVSINGGKAKFGNKTTFTYKTVVKGSSIGKKVTAKVAAFNQSDGTGMTSWSAGKSAKIKK